MSSANLIVERHSDTQGEVQVSTGMGGGGGAGKISIVTDRPVAAARSPMPVRAPAPRRVLPGPPRVPARDFRDSLSALANPAKLVPHDEEGLEDGSEDGSAMSYGGDGSDGMGSEGGESVGAGDLPDDENEPFEEELKPSEGFRSLEEEKADTIFKLERLRRRGMKGIRDFTIHSDIRDLRQELKRVRTEIELESSIQFQRKILTAIVGGIEFVNKRYSPFELELEGWSETVHDNITSYDDVFEELFYKYRNKVRMPPELTLLLMVGGSAVTFHYTNTLLKAKLPNMNPEVLQNMMQSFQQQAQQTHQAPQQPSQHAPVQPGTRPPMHGPGVDLSALLGGLPASLPTMPLPQSSRPLQPPIPPPPPPPPSPQPVPQEVDDRLSDIVSEDLQSVPEDLQSLASDLGNERKRGVKEISLVTPAKKRGRKTPAGKTKNVVVI